MEEKKFDLNSLIGFVLLGAIMIYYFYTNQPTPEQIEQRRAEQVQDSINQLSNESESSKAIEPAEFTQAPVNPSDTLAFEQAKNRLGIFAYSAGLPSATDSETIIENELVQIKVANKGGQITEVLLKNYKTFNKLPLFIIKDQNASFNMSFATQDNRNLQTKDLYFEPTLTSNGENQVLSMKLKVSSNQYLEYRYELKPDDYMLDFAVRTQGMESAINTSQAINLDWQLKSFRTEKSVKYENQYTDLRYLENGTFEYMNAMSDEDEEDVNDVNWIAFKQQFFTSVLLAEDKFESAKLISKNLVKNEDTDTVYTKQYQALIPLQAKNGELAYNMNMYYGPVDYAVLSQYKGKQMDRIVSLGWGIFRWINKYVFIPVFSVLSSFIGSFGIVIILMTIVVRIIMSPVVYKSYLSSAKMKVLRPEMQEINDKWKGKENAMKRQQETMALQRKAGVNPLSGCIPALIQMPVFFALFRFFPANIDIRQHGFLWADDLSAYDEVLKLPFKIPFYGDHVSLFPILASVAIFFYMQMTQSQQMNMQQPQQEGMPDMQKMMKMMMWFSPIMMMFFFNSYASSLSLYYFVSNLLTIAIMLVIKHFILDEDKIHAQIQENKKRPEKKKSAFRQRLDEAMKQAQEQQERQKRGR
ncbi:membrane protein insertase YidC [Lutimonas zeaxanthinifaciens]|uniref:membrane protein insertase YidC n=1 Tax=Lutimonas zeaxanthinifaciens TaxID=3060215 RepID=UPI00265CC2F7|nr:membrane protein insertase YidC [Lutimonas sp. YSD2104]WKK67467.1 membrane protein insertase YidC [Lutimonas sp. YSD2104]